MLVRFASILITLLTVQMASSEEPEVSVISDIEFATPYGTKAMDIYLPIENAHISWRPAFVWMHGAGKGDKADRRSVQICAFLARNGIVAASINYGPKAPRTESILSSKSAVRFLRQSSKYYKIDTSRIGIGGASLGGFLALMVSATSESENFQLNGTGVYPNVSDRVSLVVDFYGVVDFETLSATDEGTERSPAAIDRLRRISPSTYIGPHMVPTLILQGTADKNVPDSQSRLLSDLLTQNDVIHELLLLNGIGHSFDLNQWKGKPLPIDVEKRLLQFLGRHYPLPGPSDN